MTGARWRRGRKGGELKRCKRCNRLFRVCPYNKHSHEYCYAPSCVLERARERKRAYSSRRYQVSKEESRKLNRRSMESRKRRKARDKAAAAEKASAQAAEEKAKREAAEEVERARLEKLEREEQIRVMVCGVMAQLCGAREAPDMERFSAKTLELGMKWRSSMAAEGCQWTTAFHADPRQSSESFGRKGRSPPQQPSGCSASGCL